MLTGFNEADGDLLSTAFKAFDRGNNGYISADEFTTCIANITGT